MEVRDALKQGIGDLRAANVGSPVLAAELLLMHVLGFSRAEIYTHISDAIDPAALDRYRELLRRRAAGTPTQYLTGLQEFWGLEFDITPDVLIPRPETEHVIEVALARLGPLRRHQPLRIADVGTGSGCLAVSLAHELPEARVWAIDISSRALVVARRNASRHGVGLRVAFVQANLLAPFPPHSFDVVVSNPPYVGRCDMQSLPREVREHEPPEALFAGQKGIEVYPDLIAQAAERLVGSGLLAVELGYGVSGRVQALLGSDSWRNVSVTDDLAGIPRVLAAESAQR